MSFGIYHVMHDLLTARYDYTQGLRGHCLPRSSTLAITASNDLGGRHDQDEDPFMPRVYMYVIVPDEIFDSYHTHLYVKFAARDMGMRERRR